VVNLLVLELQWRGTYWGDYAVPGGIVRENMHSAPGGRLLPAVHPAGKVRWDAVKENGVKPVGIVIPVGLK
jgi:hypothetical protein